jgi:cell division protein FtsN
MKIEIIKDHLDHKEGDTPANLTDDQKQYLVAMGVAKVAGGKTDSPALKQKEEAQEKALEEKNDRQVASTEKVAPAKATPLKSAAKKGKK